MVWQPNILNNCYELSGGYAGAPPNHPPGALPLDPAGGLPFPRPTVPHLQILATPLSLPNYLETFLFSIALFFSRPNYVKLMWTVSGVYRDLATIDIDCVVHAMRKRRIDQ